MELPLPHKNQSLANRFSLDSAFEIAPQRFLEKLFFIGKCSKIFKITFFSKMLIAARFSIM